MNSSDKTSSQIPGQTEKTDSSADKKNSLKPKKTARQPLLWFGLWLLLIAAYALSAEWLLLELKHSSLFPSWYQIVFLTLCLLYGLAVLLVMILSRKKWLKILLSILTAVFCFVNITGFQFVVSATRMLQTITSSNPKTEETKKDDQPDPDQLITGELNHLDSQMAITLTTYALSSSGIENPSDLQNARIGVASSLDQEGTDSAISQLNEAGADFTTMEYSSVHQLADSLLSGQMDAIILPEQYHADLLSAANDVNQYNALTTFSNVVDEYIYYVPVPEEMKNEPDPVSNITQDPFTILISGSDTYGTINSLSRSDVNMLVTVNPQTKEVLLISIPRDTYTAITCKKNPNACAAVSNQKDKLTHSGIYGIGCTESSIEDLLGIEINYTVRVNFSTLINVVDALGGIDVYVEEGLEVDRFYANGTEGVSAGMNHLDGERALGFARERHAYLDDDNQRIKNQQIVMQAVLDKVMSPSMLFNYPKIIRALSTAFYTNMPLEQIQELIRFEISSFPSWKISSFALNGGGVTGYSPSLGSNVSMSVVSRDQIEFARRLGEDVIAGNSIDLSEIPVFGAPDLSEVYVLPDKTETQVQENPESDSSKEENAEADREEDSSQISRPEQKPDNNPNSPDPGQNNTPENPPVENPDISVEPLPDDYGN